MFAHSPKSILTLVLTASSKHIEAMYYRRRPFCVHVENAEKHQPNQRNILPKRSNIFVSNNVYVCIYIYIQYIYIYDDIM